LNCTELCKLRKLQTYHIVVGRRLRSSTPMQLNKPIFSELC